MHFHIKSWILILTFCAKDDSCLNKGRWKKAQNNGGSKSPERNIFSDYSSIYSFLPLPLTPISFIFSHNLPVSLSFSISLKKVLIHNGEGCLGGLSTLCIAEQSRPTPRAKTLHVNIYIYITRPPLIYSSLCLHFLALILPTSLSLGTDVISCSVGLQMRSRWLPYIPRMTDELQRLSFCLIGSV